MSTIPETNHSDPVPTSGVTVGICIFLAIAGFFLWQEHRAHLLGVLPYLFLAACPIIHLFMHRGHGGKHAAHRDEDGGRS